MYPEKKTVAYYITPHGFGHAVRSCEILRRLIELRPDVRPIIISDIPESLLEQNLGDGGYVFRRLRLDIGLFQRDSIRFDLEKTLEELEKLYLHSSQIIEGEIAFLKDNRVGAVVSDISFLPFPAAHALGIPAVGISNFTWDWIYTAYAERDPRWKGIISWIRNCYATASLFLQLPMHGDCSAFPRIESVPLVARKAARCREEVLSILGLGKKERVFLISFTNLDLEKAAYDRLEGIRDVTFLYKSPLKLPLSRARSIDGLEISYVDAVAASDAVITKPGYGIVSDCLASATPVIYTDRGLFPEYPILVETLREQLTSIYLDSDRFLAGEWEPAIREISSLPGKTPVIRSDGAEACVIKLSQFI
ncbi:MAG: hypothetical protein ABFD97_03715 [Syntrophobacter sp.]